jgi:hypothetical protein
MKDKLFMSKYIKDNKSIKDSFDEDGFVEKPLD